MGHTGVIINGYSRHDGTFRATIADRVRAVIAHQSWGAPGSNPLTDGQRLGADLGMDPVGSVELAMDLEDTFGIDLEGEVSKVPTVGDLISLVEQKLGFNRQRMI